MRPRERDPRKLIPPLHGALLKNEQDAGIFEPEGSVTAYFLAATSPVIARSEATKQSIAPRADDAWIASLLSQ